jgi:hypothetical protein
MLNDPAYATSVGLLLWKERNSGAQKWPIQPTGARRFWDQLFRIFR